MNKLKIERYIDNDLIFKRFRNLEDLKKQLNDFFNNEKKIYIIRIFRI